MGSEGPLRLFVGVELPVAAAGAVQAVADACRGRLPPLRWSRPEDRHVTLEFLGDVASTAVPGLTDRLDRVARTRSGFNTSLGGVGGFPNAAGARVVWVGLDDPEGGWSGLASAVREAFPGPVTAGPEPFVPHITLARSPRPVELPRRLLERPGSSADWLVDTFALFRSKADVGGPRYERLELFALGSPS